MLLIQKLLAPVFIGLQCIFILKMSVFQDIWLASGKH